jgi:tetratricopeptide (TPR) repeat protein
MKTIDFSHFIERYNAGEMNASEKLWFRKELDRDKNILNEIDLRKRTDKILENQNIISLRNKLSAIETQREVRKDVRKTKMPVYLKFAAVIAGLVILGSITLFSGRNLSSDEITKRYYKVYEPQTSQRAGEFKAKDDFNMALNFYNTHDYSKAAILFNKVVESNPRDMQSLLLNGVANFGDKNYPAAKQSFDKVINDNNNLFIETAQWYLALCYIKSNDKKKAVMQLEIIKEDGGIYSKNAKKILRRYI